MTLTIRDLFHLLVDTPIIRLLMWGVIGLFGTLIGLFVAYGIKAGIEQDLARLSRWIEHRKSRRQRDP